MTQIFTKSQLDIIREELVEHVKKMNFTEYIEVDSQDSNTHIDVDNFEIAAYFDKAFRVAVEACGGIK